MTKGKSPAKKSTKKVGGPFLAAAVFCEGIMEDAGKKASALGIMDGTTFWLSEDTPDDVPSESQPIFVSQNVLIIFRSGDSPGKHKLKLVVERPDGKRVKGIEKDIELSEPDHGGTNVKTSILMNIHISGTYWIDVILDGKRFTRMPLNISVRKLPSSKASHAEKQ